MTDKTDQ